MPVRAPSAKEDFCGLLFARVATLVLLCSEKVTTGGRDTVTSASRVGIPVADVVVVHVLDMRLPWEFSERRIRWSLKENAFSSEVILTLLMNLHSMT